MIVFFENKGILFLRDLQNTFTFVSSGRVLRQHKPLIYKTPDVFFNIEKHTLLMTKKYATLALLLCSLCLAANAQVVNIPDANFKNALVNSLCVDTGSDGVPDADVDTNNDGTIQVSEAMAVTRLYVASYLIQSLEGIEAFSQLEVLHCYLNQLTILNVQGLANLTELYCHENRLTTLNAQGLAKLKKLYCQKNRLTSLNVQGLTKLTELYCSDNLLTTLNVQGLTELQKVDCKLNQLATLEVQGLTNLVFLNCDFNQLSALDAQGLTNLSNLSCFSNKLITLNVQGLINLRDLSCFGNKLTTLNVQGLINLSSLNCGSNQLTALSFQGLNLQNLYCNNNQLTALELQGLTELRVLGCYSNKLTTLNVQGLSKLESLFCENNMLTALNVAGLTQLRLLRCSNNPLPTLNVQGLTNLTDLISNFTLLTTLNLKGVDNLQVLGCGGNRLTTLDIQELTKLQKLYCYSNQLTTLNVQGLNNLQSIFCEDNQLTTLNVQGLGNLQILDCNNNQLTELYIKNGSIETTLDFNNNPLAYICCDEGQLSSVQAKATINGQTNCLINTNCIQIGAHIRGSVKQDPNLNCLADSTETSLAGRIVKAGKAGAEPFYAITNTAGDYELVLDTGLYRLTVPNALSSNYYALCTDSVWVNLPQIADTAHTDFLLKPVVLCPLLEVNIASVRMRRCFQNQYIVQYCNIGPAPAPNAQVTVTLSDDVAFIGSSIPGVHLGGQDWRFSLGAVASEACGSFSINFLVICDSTVLGQSICATAHITPDSVCTPPGLPWSGAEVMVDGYCEGDSVRFVIRNIGTGNMTAAQEFVIVEDIVIFMTGTFNLAAQDSLVLKVPANGSTYHLEAGQEPTFPFPSQPSVTIEGCGLNLSGLFSLGFVSQFNEDDGNPFYSKDCREVVGAYDPNDKSAQPLGVAAPHYIEPLTPIDYLIRFQNTGTDTAFTVVIRDTLSPWLDPETFKAGIAGHPFQVDFEGHNILKFMFNNILLPDSNVNEAASHGFVRFRITPKSSTPLKTKIENRAAIFFDFNAPIITNGVFHTVDTGFLNRKTIAVFSATTPAQQLYPNPVRAGSLLFFKDLPAGKSRVSLFSTLGAVVLEATLADNAVRIPAELATGLYFMEWTGEHGVKRWGKIKIEH